MTADARGAQGKSGHEPFVLPPPLIALGGALTAGFCLLLLFGPFYKAHAAPSDHLQMWLRMLLGGRAPFALQQLVWDRFPLLMVLLFGTVLVLLPWRRAVRLRRERRAVSLTGGEETSRPSVAELEEMARSAGLRWRPDYATEGGARGLLEVLRVLENGTAPKEALPPGPAQAPASHIEAAVEEEAAAEEEADAVAGPSIAASPATPASALAGTDREDGTAPAELNDPDAEDLSGGYEVSAPAWAPSYNGSVYTSTTLYGAEPAEPAEDELDPDERDER